MPVQDLHFTRGDRIYNVINTTLISLVLLVVAYPLYFVVIASISDPVLVATGKVNIIPVGLTFDGYVRIMGYSRIWIGYRNTALYTLCGTALNITLTVTAGYTLSRRNLFGRRLLMGLLTFTMYFSGGLVPLYQVVLKLNLINKPVVMIILGAVSIYNVIITRTFFESFLPEELRESAMVDGCNDFRFFLKIALPLATTIIAVLVVFYAVGHWNQFFNGIIFLRNRAYLPLQVFLREILILDQFGDTQQIMFDENATRNALIAMSMKYGIIIVSSLPVLVLYPFMQKYFVKGVMIGAVKG